MPKLCVVLLAATLIFVGANQSFAQANPKSEEPPRPSRPVHTFSIVARDPVTGELGVAVNHTGSQSTNPQISQITQI
jgi:hypothetical protein